MDEREVEKLKSEYIGRLAVKSLDENILADVSRDENGNLIQDQLSREFGSSGGLMSKFDCAVRLSKTNKRIKDIESIFREQKINY